MGVLMLTPPITFAIYLLLSMGISVVSKRLAARGVDSKRKENAYACGEDMAENQGQPDYSEFFMLAFFFTIIHVIALVVATDQNGFSVTTAVYIGVTVLALFMLLRK